jgi:hypothetical protein
MGSQRAAVVDENTDNGTPNIAYCRVKLATENALRSAATPGMTLVILRPPFIWGPGITTIAEAVEAANKGQWMWIDGGWPAAWLGGHNVRVCSTAHDGGSSSHPARASVECSRRIAAWMHG